MRVRSQNLEIAITKFGLRGKRFHKIGETNFARFRETGFYGKPVCTRNRKRCKMLDCVIIAGNLANQKPMPSKHEIGFTETRNRCRRNTKPVSPKHEIGVTETRNRCHRNTKPVSSETRNMFHRNTKPMSPKHETGVVKTRNRFAETRSRCHPHMSPVSPKHETSVVRNTKPVSSKTRNRCRPKHETVLPKHEFCFVFKGGAEWSISEIHIFCGELIFL